MVLPDCVKKTLHINRQLHINRHGAAVKQMKCKNELKRQMHTYMVMHWNFKVVFYEDMSVFVHNKDVFLRRAFVRMLASHLRLKVGFRWR